MISFQGTSFSTTIIIGQSDTISVLYQNLFSTLITILGGRFSTRITFTQLDTVLGTTLIGRDLNNTPYTQNGLSTPFVNVGPSISSPGAIGGWRLSPAGTQGTSDYSLTAQQNTSSGLVGPVYSILPPIARILSIDTYSTAGTAYAFQPTDLGSLLLLQTPTANLAFTITPGFLAAANVGFYLTIKNIGSHVINVNSTVATIQTINSGTTWVIYWSGAAFSLY